MERKRRIVSPTPPVYTGQEEGEATQASEKRNVSLLFSRGFSFLYVRVFPPKKNARAPLQGNT